MSDRADVVKRLIDAYKFERAKAASASLVDLLDSRLPQLPADTVVAPIPTVSSHIRQRGYDHMGMIARGLARRRRLRYLSLLGRVTNDTQHGASKRERLRQAAAAFRLQRSVDPTVPYLIVDDIMTTGATLGSASDLLRQAGASQIWVAIVARQPLD